MTDSKFHDLVVSKVADRKCRSDFQFATYDGVMQLSRRYRRVTRRESRRDSAAMVGESR